MIKRTKANGRFERIPDGQKTPKMLEVEEKIGRTLEEDYQELYFNQDWGQKRLATRWGVPRNLIFSTNNRESKRCWVQKLNLTKKDEIIPNPIKKKSCEICGYDEGSLEKAHWIPFTKQGSTKSYNILLLCPNCHTQLDNNEPEITEKALIILFHRSMKTFLSKSILSFEEKKEVLEIAKQIINRTI